TPDQYRTLPDTRPIPDDDLEIWDDKLASVSAADKITLLRGVEQAALDYDPRIILAEFCNYGDAVSHFYLANSKGFAGQYGRTTAFAYLMSIARGEDGEMTNAFGMGASNYFGDLDPKAIGVEASEKAVSMLGGKPVPTQVGTVVFDY